MSLEEMNIDVLIDFPNVRQIYDYDCGASAVQAVLWYYGYDIREDKILKDLETEKLDGTKISEIVDYFKEKHFSVWNGSGSIEKLKELLYKKIPVIILLQAWNDSDNRNWEDENKNGHYVVAIGYGGGRIFFEDPSSEYIVYLNEDEFKRKFFLPIS